MYITAAVLSVVLALVAVAAGVPKALLKGDVSAGLQSHMGLSAGLVRFVGLAEVAAFVGLIVGLFWQPLGIAAAVGFGITMIGAVGYHAKARRLRRPRHARKRHGPHHPRAGLRGDRRHPRPGHVNPTPEARRDPGLP